MPDDVHDGLTDYAASPDPDVALVLVHSGGPKGSGLLTKLRKLPSVSEHKSEAVKGGGFVQFAVNEARRHKARIDPEAASALVEAVGPDLRSLAAAVDQLAHDFPGEPLDLDLVRRYFSGRADVKGYEIAEHAINGRTARALEELRWAMETGVGGPAGHRLVRLGGARVGPVQGRPAGLRTPTWRARSGCPRSGCGTSASRPTAGTTTAWPRPSGRSPAPTPT